MLGFTKLSPFLFSPVAVSSAPAAAGTRLQRFHALSQQLSARYTIHIWNQLCPFILNSTQVFQLSKHSLFVGYLPSLQVLQSALLRLAREHPFHMLYQLFALTHPGPSKAPAKGDAHPGVLAHSVDKIRVEAAAHLLQCYGKSGTKQAKIKEQVSSRHSSF